MKVPAPSLAKSTVPLGVVAVPGELSVTVAVHVEGVPIGTLPGLHETTVEVERALIISVTRLDTSWINETAFAAVS